MTRRGFWLVAALSRYTSGLPRTRCDRMGKSWRSRSTSRAGTAAGALMIASQAAEALEDQPIQLLTDRHQCHLVHDFGGKRVGQQPISSRRRQAATARAEPGEIVQPTDRGAMGALHVIGEDL